MRRQAARCQYYPWGGRPRPKTVDKVRVRGRQRRPAQNEQLTCLLRRDVVGLLLKTRQLSQQELRALNWIHKFEDLNISLPSGDERNAEGTRLIRLGNNKSVHLIRLTSDTSGKKCFWHLNFSNCSLHSLLVGKQATARFRISVDHLHKHRFYCTSVRAASPIKITLHSCKALNRDQRTRIKMRQNKTQVWLQMSENWHRNVCNVAVHVWHGCRDETDLSTSKKSSITKLLYICVRFLSYRWSARLWAQLPPTLRPRPRLLLRRPRRLHFPAHHRCCSCVCFSFLCCSSGWAFYRIRVPSVTVDLYQRRLSALSDISVDSMSAAARLQPCVLVPPFVGLPADLSLAFRAAPTAAVLRNKLL